VDGLARVRQAEAEHRRGHQLAAEPDHDLPEVDLRFPPRQVLLRDESVRRFPTRLDTDLPATGRDILAHHPVGDDACGVVLVEETVEDPGRGVTLLPWRVEIIPQPTVDDRLERVQPTSALGRGFRFLRPSRRERLHDGAVADAVLALQRPLRQSRLRVSSDRGIQVNSRSVSSFAHVPW